MKKNLDDAKGLLAEKLPKTLWAYRMTHKTSIGETQLKLAFGIKVVVLVQIGMPSF